MVVDQIVEGFYAPRVLMDGGSGVNIIFPNTLAKMGISGSLPIPSPTGFHGFMSIGQGHPLGQLDL